LSADVELDRPTIVEALGYMPAAEDTDTHRPIKMNGTEILGDDNNTPLNLKAGTNVSLSNNSGTVTINATDTDTTDLTQMTGVLELNHGGTGRNLSSISDNCIIRKSNSNDSVSGLYGIVPSSGALYYTGAANAVPQFGTLPMA
jgi:hypothetical protein